MSVFDRVDDLTMPPAAIRKPASVNLSSEDHHTRRSDGDRRFPTLLCRMLPILRNRSPLSAAPISPTVDVF
jgi:hypothetical protein